MLDKKKIQVKIDSSIDLFRLLDELTQEVIYFPK